MIEKCILFCRTVFNDKTVILLTIAGYHPGDGILLVLFVRVRLHKQTDFLAYA